ncbi:MAG: sensor histidine kinase [Pirellulales bacterium]|jgi:signal transduction histidine kinase
MIKLFFRFFIGMILLGVAASVIQSYVVYQKSDENTVAWIKNLFGGVGAAARQISSLEMADREAAIVIAEKDFGFPITLVETTSDPQYVWFQRYLTFGEPKYISRTEVAVLIDDGRGALIFGPVNEWQRPTATSYVIATTAYVIFSMVVIAFLIRPIAIQFKSITRAAVAISGGNLSARITGPATNYRDPAVTAFNLMAKRTENLIKAKIELLQMVSHEIRTPLSRIHFAVELFESESDPEKRSERIAAIVESTDDLDRLVSDLLKYVRSGESGIEKKPVFIAELLSNIQRSMVNHDKSISVKLDGNAVVQCDPVLLNSVIGNLVGNASQFANQEIGITSDLEHGTLLLHIDDDGPGIPVEYREDIFEPFSRLDNSKVGHKNGVGLGLAIVQRALEHCGGEVVVSDSPLGGARFTVRLPLLEKE